MIPPRLADAGELTDPALPEITMAKPSRDITGWDTIPVRGGEGLSVRVERHGAPVTGLSSP